MIKEHRKSLISKIDAGLLFVYLFMTIWGWLNIYATEFSHQHVFNPFDTNTYYGRQFVWLIISYIIAFLILIMDVRVFTTFAYVFYALFLILLIATFFIGVTVSGTKSWIALSETARLQPSELMKAGVALALAKFISYYGFSFKKTSHFLIVLSLIATPVGIILLMNDAGTAVIFMSFLFPLYRFGLPLTPYVFSFWFIILFILALLVNKYLLLVIFFIMTIWLLWYFRKQRQRALVIIFIAIISSIFVYTVDFAFDRLLKPHQKDRFYVLLGKEVDPKGIGYNVNQSLIAIGSGGFSGKGFLKGTQTLYNFVPEQRTDFIFCTIAEQWGFVGSTILLLAFLYLITRIIILSEKQRSTFSKVYGYSLASLLFFHFFINVGMTLNILPVIGITLPFFSYGGSSLLAFTIMIFIFIKLNTKHNEIV